MRGSVRTRQIILSRAFPPRLPAKGEYTGVTEIYAATTAFIEHKNQRAALTLREGQCFVCIERGHDPIWMDLAPGDYLIDAEDVSDNETGFPVMVAVVAKDHLAAWLDLPTRAIDAMLSLIHISEPTRP